MSESADISFGFDPAGIVNGIEKASNSMKSFMMKMNTENML